MTPHPLSKFVATNLQAALETPPVIKIKESYPGYNIFVYVRVDRWVAQRNMATPKNYAHM